MQRKGEGARERRVKEESKKEEKEKIRIKKELRSDWGIAVAGHARGSDQKNSRICMRVRHKKKRNRRAGLPTVAYQWRVEGDV